MNKEQFKPFLEWMMDERSFYQWTRAEECVEQNDITGIWGYLLEFFDGEGVKIHDHPPFNAK